MPRVFSSVQEVWQGVLSGAIVPTHHHTPSSRSQRRRVSCSNIQPHGAGSGSSSEDISGRSSSDTDGNESTNLMDLDEDFECSVSVRLEDNEDNDKSYDISTLSDADLRRLKKEDPFLYYSIRRHIRRRSYRLNDPGHVRHEQDVAGGGGPRRNRARRSSLPAALLANAEISRSSRQLQVELNDQDEEQDSGMIEQQVPLDDPQGRRDSVVRRNRRLSTEAHPTLICDSLLRELQELDGDNSFIDDDDLALLGQELDDDTF